MSPDRNMKTNKTPKPKRKYRVYTAQFKKEAAAMAKELGSSETARKLNVPLANIDKWKSGHSMKMTSSPEIKELQDEIRKLKRQAEQDAAIIEVLKKTAAIFSKGHLT
jgi:transposase-like protein